MTTDQPAPHSLVELRAPAKLTTELHITGVRDDGYHLIDAEMISLDLHDMVLVDPGGSGFSVSGPFGADVPTDGSNLVLRALELVGRRAGVHLVKHIPHGGGLGGGSADAAAILRWAGFDDLDAASRLGADIAYCLVGGRARVRGIGEQVTPLPPQERIVTLVIPPFGVSTPAVYRRWDELGGPVHATNDLEPAAVSVEPRLLIWRDRIGTAAGTPPVLAGSGSTWFLDGDHGDRLAALRAQGATVIVSAAAPRQPVPER